ncbi:uncharacterized protein [Atheta coriaria]|uniref:uncharacterized protein n=1 Tax=Dalotia coriaria TaxID=877792 RepID=UPI0031F42DE3
MKAQFVLFTIGVLMLSHIGHVANGTALDELRVIARSNPGLLESVLHLLQHCQKPTVLASRFYPGMIPESPRSHSNSSASISTSIGCKRCLENEKRNFVAVPSADKNWHDFLVRFQAKIPRHMLDLEHGRVARSVLNGYYTFLSLVKKATEAKQVTVEKERKQVEWVLQDE